MAADKCYSADRPTLAVSAAILSLAGADDTSPSLPMMNSCSCALALALWMASNSSVASCAGGFRIQGSAFSLGA